MNTQETVTSLKKTVGAAMLKPLGFMRRKHVVPGARPGVDHLPEASAPPQEGRVSIACVGYGPELHSSLEVDDLDAFLEQEQPKGAAVRWNNVNGLHAYTVRRLQEVYSYHSLAAEDVLHTTQRPKVGSGTRPQATDPDDTKTKNT
ncbi:MAG: hypothetical protein ACI8Y8_001108 [Planctomycetota bacterium]|jgi:hypothetical protein